MRKHDSPVYKLVDDIDQIIHYIREPPQWTPPNTETTAMGTGCHGPESFTYSLLVLWWKPPSLFRNTDTEVMPKKTKININFPLKMDRFMLTGVKELNFFILAISILSIYNTSRPLCTKGVLNL